MPWRASIDWRRHKLLYGAARLYAHPLVQQLSEMALAERIAKCKHFARGPRLRLATLRDCEPCTDGRCGSARVNHVIRGPCPRTEWPLSILPTCVPRCFAAFVSLSGPIPAMIVGNRPVAPFPVTREVSALCVVRRHPIRARVRRPCPVAVMPDVASILPIPVALDPLIIRTGLRRHVVYARCWRRMANLDPDRNLRGSRRRNQERRNDES
jgi:hypothetical protein